MNRLIEEIAEANNWRDGEFAKLKVNAAGVEEELWCRMCIPIIYAHWEGYIVSSLKLLIEYLNKQELSSSDVPNHLVVTSLGDVYKTLGGKQSFSQRVAFTEKFSEMYQSSLTFEKRIDTKSNLKSSVLKELCVMFGLNYERFEDYASDIDRLVNIRNRIAHGENSIVASLSNVEKYIDSVVKATDIFLEEVSLFVEGKEYLLNKSA